MTNLPKNDKYMSVTPSAWEDQEFKASSVI